MPINSRAKGVRGELELAAILREYGFEAKRGQQHAGGADSQDVKHNIDGFHFECKLVEGLSLYPAMEQAKRDKAPDDIPVVAHRRNKKEWLAILPLRDFLKLLKEEVFIH